MLNLRRLAGGFGIDLSLMGWADMLAGGLGDGAAFHTSAQIMRRSTLIRQACIDAFNHLMVIHWGIKHGEYFNSNEYPWQFDFYSDQNAAATQALNNKQNRANTTTVQAQAIQMLKDLGLDKETIQLILEDSMGYDIELAEKIATSVTAQPLLDANGAPMQGDAMPAGAAHDDDVPDDLLDDDDDDY